MTIENALYKIGITHGDVNGISYEVIMKALQDTKMLELCTPIVYGLSKATSFHRKAIEMTDFNFQFIKAANQAALKRPNLINLSDTEVKIEFGAVSKEAGNMAEKALDAACKDLKANSIDAIVTAPINKQSIQSPTFHFNGHTEYFTHHFKAQESMMLMVTDRLKVGFVTNHLSIEQVAKELTRELILKKLRILHKSLVQDFACTNPKIAVLSLNPHAGDGNLLGREESDKIIPAINQAYEERINAVGPFPADGFFGSGKQDKFDAVLAIYHDQGMLPFKLLSQGEGVNYTAGLPIVRTSPAHGTAFDIAGKNLSSGQSMRNAIYLAIDILRNRRNIQEYTPESKK